MKIVSPSQMQDIESVAYRGGFSEDAFMQEAGSGVALVVHDFVEQHELVRVIYLLCGKGNNAGDAYVAGLDLLLLEYDVTAIQIAPLEECSPLCRKHCERFQEEGGKVITFPFHETLRLPDLGILVDGLFGTGFKGSIHEPYAALVRLANQSGLPIISVDIPSGLNGETGEVQGEAIIATETAFLGLPKSGFFLKSGWDHVGKLRYVDFGLPKEVIDPCQTDLHLLTSGLVSPWLPRIKNSRHKYERGCVMAFAGSPGMCGAALMSTLAALRGGAGIVKLLHTDEMRIDLGSSVPELIKIPFKTTPAEFINSGSAALIGPAIGTSAQSAKWLEEVLSGLQKPAVIDADALTLIARHGFKIPENSVLTPHKGELARLFKRDSIGETTADLLLECQKFSEQNRCTLVLKGGPTFIFHPNEPILVSKEGSPGMATAGSGDVLTGLIAALLAQKIPAHHAAALGVYMHGLAGEFAANDWTPHCMTATDIIFHFPEAFRECSEAWNIKLLPT